MSLHLFVCFPIHFPSGDGVFREISHKNNSYDGVRNFLAEFYQGFMKRVDIIEEGRKMY